MLLSLPLYLLSQRVDLKKKKSVTVKDSEEPILKQYPLQCADKFPTSIHVRVADPNKAGQLDDNGRTGYKAQQCLAH